MRRNITALNSASIYVFGSDLQLSTDGKWNGLPPWTLEAMRRKGGIAEKIQEQVSKLKGTAILSAENLETDSFPSYFEGLDREIDIDIICYFRPYHSVIPSRWQQWGTKSGTPLINYIEECIKTGQPSYRKSLEAWRKALPRSRISVIPFVSVAMSQGNPASDFFSRVGFRGDHERNAYSNASCDYALIDLFQRESNQLFFEPGVHPSTRLKPLLPPEYRKANAPLVSRAWVERLEERFREETLQILKEFSNVSDADAFYQAHFMPLVIDDPAYIDMSSRDVLVRAFSILIDTLGEDEMSHVIGQALAAHLKAMLKDSPTAAKTTG